jgi:hypothetical protein
LPKLDRIPHFDARSLDFPVRTLLPRRVERRQRLWALPAGYPLDQGDDGACVGFGYTGELAADPVVVPDTGQAFAQQLYELARAEDRKMGNTWAEGASMLAGAKALKNTGKITSYRWAFGIDDVIDTLCTIGPVVLGINWYTSMFQTRTDGLVTITGGLAGGHCILANGYWPAHPKFGEVIVWTNSWGRSYGLSGVGFIKVADLARLLKEQGEAAIVVDVAPVVPTPPPPPPPTPEPLFVAARYSRAFHKQGAHWWVPETRAWASRDGALAAGLRPCRLCKP